MTVFAIVQSLSISFYVLRLQPIEFSLKFYDINLGASILKLIFVVFYFFTHLCLWIYENNMALRSIIIHVFSKTTTVRNSCLNSCARAEFPQLSDIWD